MYWVNSYLQEVWIETYSSVWYPRWVCLRRQVLPLNPVDPPVEGPPTQITREPPTHLPPTGTPWRGTHPIMPTHSSSEPGHAFSPNHPESLKLWGQVSSHYLPTMGTTKVPLWSVEIFSWQNCDNWRGPPCFSQPAPSAWRPLPPFCNSAPGILGFRRCRSTPPSRRWTSQTCWRLSFLSSPFSFLRGVYPAANAMCIEYIQKHLWRRYFTSLNLIMLFLKFLCLQMIQIILMG